MQEDWRGKHIFNLKILWDDSEGQIQVHENDEPSILSQEFTKVNNLPENFSELIEHEIEKKIDEVLNNESMNNDSELNISDLNMKPSILKSTCQSSTSISKNNRKLSQYTKIFKFLADGEFISPQSMACLDLKHRLCRILMPLLIDINATDEIVDFERFCLKMYALENLLSTQDLKYLKEFQLDLKSVSPKERRVKFEKNLLNETVTKKYYNLL